MPTHYICKDCPLEGGKSHRHEKKKRVTHQIEIDTHLTQQADCATDRLAEALTGLVLTDDGGDSRTEAHSRLFSTRTEAQASCPQVPTSFGAISAAQAGDSIEAIIAHRSLLRPSATRAREYDESVLNDILQHIRSAQATLDLQYSLYADRDSCVLLERSLSEAAAAVLAAGRLLESIKVSASTRRSRKQADKQPAPTIPPEAPTSPRKRQRNPRNAAAPPAPGPAGPGPAGFGAAAPPAEPNAKAAKTGKTPKRPRKKDERPKDERDTTRAFQRHIRALMGLLTASSVLGRADVHIDFFNKRFEAVDDLPKHIADLVDECQNPTDEAAELATRLQERINETTTVTAKGSIASDLAQVPYEHLKCAFAAVAAVGLKVFHPDVFGPAHSQYNQTHRHIATATFQNSVAWFGFNKMSASLVLTRDTRRLHALYDSFVGGTIGRNCRWAETRPNALVESAALQNVKKNREGVAERRYRQAKLENMRNVVLRAIKHPSIHSDDEIIPPEPVGPNDNRICTRQVCEKEYRHPAFTAYFRHLDVQIDAKWARNPKGKRPEFRKISELKPPSALSRIHPPSSYTVMRGDEEVEYIMPIDVFSPEYYNTVMDVEERALFAENGVAFPAAEFMNTPEQITVWKRMGMTEFMAKYGTAVLESYRRPSEEELEDEANRRAAEEGDGEWETDLDDSEPEPEPEPEQRMDDIQTQEQKMIDSLAIHGVQAVNLVFALATTRTSAEGSGRGLRLRCTAEPSLPAGPPKPTAPTATTPALMTQTRTIANPEYDPAKARRRTSSR
ncbi:hypothetical protein MKEN_00576800 [Mycena kentingensis (nom. inval.)]|nr:hypothetical protein MKEN_00576800 [Mycena kentingensis (nom. inval.)]